MYRWSVGFLLFLGFVTLGFAKAGILEPALALAVQSEQKEIKDPAEYHAYMTAYNMADPAAKGAAMESFVAQYAQSVVRVDALEQAMAAYQQAGNVQKLEQVARKLVDVDSDNVRPVAILTVLLRAQLTQGDNTKLTDLCSYSHRGAMYLASWAKPENLPEASFAALRNQMAEIFYGGDGLCSLKMKAYDLSSENYLKALQINPGDAGNNFELGTAKLEKDPMDLNGFWYLAKAIRLARSQQNQTAVASISDYGKAKYRRYHGGEDGWDKLLATAGDGNAVPAGFAESIKKAPSEAEQACNAVRDNDPSDLSFSDWAFVLEHRDDAPCNADAAGKVWAALQKLQKNGKAKLKLEAKVISVHGGNMMGVAVTEDHQKSGEIDLEIVMEKSIARPPAKGEMVNVTGVITKYTPRPFFFEMQEGEFSLIGTGPKISRP
jgi:tetratricopeptide (TPR) repeat protein